MLHTGEYGFTMNSHPVRCCIFVCLLCICHATYAQEADESALPFVISDWLHYAERRDVPWDVKVLKPRLTLQQRNLVQVDARINAGRLKNRDKERDLHFVLKVADADDNWVPGYSYTHLPVPAGLEAYHQIQCVTGLYLRPGRYTLALIIYEANLEQVNVWKKDIEVKNQGGDLLRDLDRDLPEIEFISGTPDYVMDFDVPPSFMDSIWPLGSGLEWLPVQNGSDICIDIIVNVSYSQVLRGESSQQWWLNYRMNSSYMLQVGSVLSHLGLNKGCIRITVVDLLSMKTLFYRENAETFDWQEADRVIGSQNRFTIDVDRLSSYTQSSAYFNATLNDILEDGACATGEDALPRTVIVVSNQQVFPEETEIVEIKPPDPESTRFFYFCINNRPFITGDINRMLESTALVRFMVRQPLDLRKALSELIIDLEK